MQSTCFGQVGRALLGPLYARAHATQKQCEAEGLNGPLRSSIRSLRHLLQHLPPKEIPLSGSYPTMSLYTDAFFQLGDKKLQPFADEIPRDWQTSKAQWATNGWGFVMRRQTQTLCAHGVIPPSLLKPYGKRRAFIYVLELMAPVIAVTALQRVLDPFIVLWIDNRAGLSALSKGYGRDPAVNSLLTFTWAFLARVGVFLHCEWVASRHNLADGISRHDLQDTLDGGWTLIQLPLQPLYRILKRCAEDLDYAATGAVDDALQWSQSLVLADLVQLGSSELEMGWYPTSGQMLCYWCVIAPFNFVGKRQQSFQRNCKWSSQHWRKRIVMLWKHIGVRGNIKRSFSKFPWFQFRFLHIDVMQMFDLVCSRSGSRVGGSLERKLLPALPHPDFKILRLPSKKRHPSGIVWSRVGWYPTSGQMLCYWCVIAPFNFVGKRQQSFQRNCKWSSQHWRKRIVMLWKHIGVRGNIKRSFSKFPWFQFRFLHIDVMQMFDLVCSRSGSRVGGSLERKLLPALPHPDFKILRLPSKKRHPSGIVWSRVGWYPTSGQMLCYWCVIAPFNFVGKRQQSFQRNCKWSSQHWRKRIVMFYYHLIKDTGLLLWWLSLEQAGHQGRQRREQVLHFES